MIGQVNEVLQQIVIDAVELLPKIGCGPQQKPPQALRSGVSRKTGQILKGAIRTQERRCLQTIQPQNNWVDQGQDHLGKLVVTGATVNRSLTTLKLMFGRAEKCGFGVSNPVRGVAYLPESAGRIRVVTFQEELTYLSKASQPLRDIAQTILDTGLRPEEVFRIRVENIDFAARTIFNPFGKTKAARRAVTMTDTVWTALKPRAKTANGSYVFPSEKHPDRPIASVRKGHNASIRRAAIKPHFVLYDLRHTFATRAVAAGVDLPTLSAMLGHTSITMTMRYVHPAAEQKKLAAAKLESFRINGLIEAASEQAVGTKIGTAAQVN